MNKLTVGKGIKIHQSDLIQKKVDVSLREHCSNEKLEQIDISIPERDRNGHFWCFGTTRIGKTTLLTSMCEQDIRAGRSVIVVDPKVSFDLLARIVQTAAEENRLEDLDLISYIFPDVSSVIEGEPRFISRLKKGKRVILVVQLGILLDRHAASNFGKTLMSIISRYAEDLVKKGDHLPQPVCIYLDDSQIYLEEDFIQASILSHNTNFWVHGFTQSLCQLNASLGSKTTSYLLDNVLTKMCMRVTDTETAESQVNSFGLIKTQSSRMAKVIETRLDVNDVLYQEPRAFFLNIGQERYLGHTLTVELSWITIKEPKNIRQVESSSSRGGADYECVNDFHHHSCNYCDTGF